MLTGSNGMCAGNSREEAILQGISEVFERQVHYELVLNNIVPPEIDREVFEGTDREYWFKQYNMGINNGSGYFPLNFVLEEGTPDYEFRGFEHPVSVSNEDDLAYYMDIIRRSHKKLYIADRSSLGFPAYYTFIPSFSETTFLFFINNGIIPPALPAKRDMSQSKKLYKIPLSTFSMM